MSELCAHHKIYYIKYRCQKNKGYKTAYFFSYGQNNLRFYFLERFTKKIVCVNQEDVIVFKEVLDQ